MSIFCRYIIKGSCQLLMTVFIHKVLVSGKRAADPVALTVML